eukprot:11575867-Alexandrium_andersonii.AAC.1
MSVVVPTCDSFEFAGGGQLRASGSAQSAGSGWWAYCRAFRLTCVFRASPGVSGHMHCSYPDLFDQLGA